MEKLKKYRTKMIISGLYIALLLLFLVSISLARYQDTLTAYTNFGIASFNTVILGETTLANLQDESTVVEQFGATLSTADYHPGMVWSSDDADSTAQEFPFTIANGTTEENRADGTVEYTIKLRTLGSLPLTYQLAEKTVTATTVVYSSVDGVTYLSCKYDQYGTLTVSTASGVTYEADEDGNPISVTVTNDDETTTTLLLTGTDIYTTTRYTYNEIFYTPDEPTIVYDDSNQVWYEYTFYVDNANTEEARFTLDGSALNLNAYSLVIEWPVITEQYITVAVTDDDGEETGKTVEVLDEDFIATNDAYYMKELETIEIVVEVTSKNETDETITDYTLALDESTLDLDAEGVIILHPDSEAAIEGTTTSNTTSAATSFHYDIDLRSFTLEQTETEDEAEPTPTPDAATTEWVEALGFAFEINNGVAYQMEAYEYTTSTYTMQLKVPYGTGLSDYNFTLYEADTRSTGIYNGVPTTTLEGYYIYDEYTGERVDVTVITEGGEPITPVGYTDAQYAMYALYNLTFVVTTETETEDGTTTTTAPKDLTLTNWKNASGVAWAEFKDSDSYYLEITTVYAEDELDIYAFSNKLELLIDVTYRGTMS